MQAQLNGKLMNQLAIFFSTIVMLQFIADVTGFTQNLDITYNLIHTAASYITFSLAVIFTLIGARRELSKYAIISLCLVVGIKAKGSLFYGDWLARRKRIVNKPLISKIVRKLEVYYT
ncbi:MULTISPECIES: hypothetical protein [Bacillus]|uniref:Group-Specific protein n=4 Tax=Bacillus cereus group TaxID=86661 RepID=A0A640L3B8_BACAN|nr:MULTISPECIES: hypothetical protein [Bacillus]ACK90280.1 conserved hypothetical protein [Bacillus cereus AH820]ACP14072.1 conserved hypothetical protein [Bacillus anthracis str. CDC 684]AHE82494.1 hypothetical protein A16R_11520 [Bacillus anthracis str. A16R]AIK63043.1 hypothetical protein DJ46_5529 [Bacillus anthracis str. Vollum]EJT18189.1 hypothetical protein B353_25061 [Bacillus anthracis str. UR-1]EXJ21572.1 hypothetical protein Y693_05700 [Bacillus anthracis str. 95014]QHD21062.1 hyp